MNTAPQRIGRFEIRRLLGKGAQSQVYLAYDPKLHREVAIKSLRADPRLAGSLNTRLHEAQAAARLRHATLVPIFELGEDDGRQFFVFEYVEGDTLAEIIRRGGGLAPARAVKLMLDVLDGLIHAHKAGIVHRDLKPSNVMVTPEGLARVMDFGVASDISSPDSADDVLFGTPAYMAPEYIARRVVSPQGDVFAAGLLLFEMLFGRPAVHGHEVFQVMNEICNSDIRLPIGDDEVDAHLRTILSKALARDPAQRYADATAMRDGLKDYSETKQAISAGSHSASATLEFLLRRMSHTSDFPAMSGAIAQLTALTASGGANAEALAGAIVKDFALTNKILKLANSAFYGMFGGQISTVSRAIVILGMETIRNIATALTLFDHMKDKAHAAKLRDDFLRSNLQAMIAREICGVNGTADATEEAFICGLFHDLGRLLTHYYFNEEFEAINRAVQVNGRSEAVASAEVLGISYEQLGIGVARKWGFPDVLINSMKRLPPGEVRLSPSHEDHMRALAEFSKELAALLEQPGQPSDEELMALQKRFAKFVKADVKTLREAADKSSRGLAELSDVLGITLGTTRLGRLLRGDTEVEPEPIVEEPGVEHLVANSTIDGHDGALTQSATTVLTDGLADISHALLDGAPAGDLMQIVVETIYRALAPQRVVLCLRDARAGEIRARFGVGEGVDELRQNFVFKLSATDDLFNVCLQKDVDVLIRDASEPRFKKHLPQWYATRFEARTLLLLPMVLAGKPVALIYVDVAEADALQPTAEQMKMLRTLRNQVLLAMRQSRR